MNAEAIADLAIQLARERILDAHNAGMVVAFDVVQNYVRQAIHDAVREVHIAAPGVVIEDKREHGGAVVSDLRGVQDKANG
jgi:hypothetical protein